MNESSIIFNNALFQNLVNNMKNEIGRKITSLTLMTIMLAGGMTIAFPGFTPDAYAVNANLIVSAENTGGDVDGAQIIEIVVIDEDISASPDITVNGDAVRMVKATDGNWYAYIAHTSAVEAVAGTDALGITFGTQLPTLAGSDSVASYTGAAQNVLKAAKSFDTAGPNAPAAGTWPIVQTYEFPTNIEIEYNKAGGTQTSTLTYDDAGSPGLSLDRSIYPPGAQVHVTIEDNRLNIDPTSDDIWAWNVVSQEMYYMLGTSATDRERVISSTETFTTANTTAAGFAATAACGDCALLIDPNTRNDNLEEGAVLELVSLGDLPIRATAEEVEEVRNADGVVTTAIVTPEMWFTVAEDGGPNTAIFTATDLNDESILRIADDAARGSFATIDYDDSVTGIQVQFSEATIDIESPDDVWTSGQSIPIVLVDGDVNKNSLSGDDLSLFDANSIIPTLVTGDPFTLGEVESDLTTWVVLGNIGTTTEFTALLDSYNRDHIIAEECPTRATTSCNENLQTIFDRIYSGTDNTQSDRLSTGLTYTNNPGVDPFTIKGLSISDNDDNFDGLLIDTATDENNLLVLRQPAQVEAFSERAILELGIPDSDDVPRASIVNSLNGLLNTPTAFTSNTLVIDFGDNVEELRNSLINTADKDNPAVGYNFFNFNVESMKTGDVEHALDIINVVIDENEVKEKYVDIDPAAQSGYVPADNFDDIVGLVDGDLQLKLTFDTDFTIPSDGTEKRPMVVDFFSFGYKNDGEASDERIANQIIRLELEENGSDTGSLEGTLEYIMINQLNIDDRDTYEGLTTVSDAVSFIVIEDLTGSSAPSVTYLDVDTTGTQTQVSAQEDAPSHSAVVSLSVDSFKAADTVTVTLEDLDLNVDSDLVDIYTVVDRVYSQADEGEDVVFTKGSIQYAVADEDDGTIADANHDAVGQPYDADDYDGVELGRLLDITFDDQRWMTHTDDKGDTCTPKLDDNSGLGKTNFSLIETGSATGIFVGTFPIPAEFCREGSSTPESVTGLDIEVNYVDFRDASGETTEVGDSAGIKASTGSVSLDRTVYPVPFGIVSDFDDSTSTTPAQSNTNTRSIFPIHQNGMDDESGLQSGEFLPQGDLIVYVTVTDPDFDVSASGRDSIALDVAPVTVSVIRSSQSITVATIGDTSNPIDEIAPDAGIFEASVTIEYSSGPNSSLCPSADDDDPKDPTDDKGCILQGDILQVEYNDPTDASGQSNTVTDSATFDLRNGVLQSDKSVYIIGSDMILTLIEPDFDLDSSQNETYDLDLIKWSSSAATVTMGDADGEIGAFDPEPLSFRETGPSTGIFQVVVEIPQILDGSSLQRGEEIDLEYTDWGPSGSDYVGDQDEDIRLTVFTSNFGATIDLDQKVYSWTDKVYITIVAPDHNFDNNLIDEIGETDEDPLRVATKGFDLDNYRLVETGFDTGIFTGEVILTGFAHDPTGDGNQVVPRTAGNGPTDGYLQTPSDGGISVSYEFSEDETVFTSSIIRWNIGDVQWLEASYPASGTGVLRVIDPDMNLNPEAVDNFDVNIASDTDASGITLTITETNEATGIFEGTVFFTTTGGSSGHRLRVSEGDTVTADYADGTLPLPYTTNDQVSITSTTIIGTIVPPLERAPATNLRIVDTFGSSIDAVSTDQQVQITADLSNGQDRDQDFAYLIQIQNSEGVTVSLSWIAGSLSPGQSFSPSASWTPTSVGTYDVTAFVWESIDNPTALSPPLTIDVSVN